MIAANLEYRFCDDWFIYAEDAETGQLYSVSTELWSEWIDAAAEKLGVDPDSSEGAFEAALEASIDQEPDAFERYMLPVARRNWDRLNWRPVPEED